MLLRERQPFGPSRPVRNRRASFQLLDFWVQVLRALLRGRLLLRLACANSVGVEGRTITIEYRWSEGRPERYAEIAAEFVRSNVDVILTVGSAVPIVRQATTVIPIVFAVAIDPVGSGLVASLAKPGGNATGLSIQANELAGKRLEFLREAIPQLYRLAILFNADNTQPVLEMGEAQAEARRLRLEIAPLAIRGGLTISGQRSKISRLELTRCMLPSINSSWPTARKSSRLH